MRSPRQAGRRTTNRAPPPSRGRVARRRRRAARRCVFTSASPSPMPLRLGGDERLEQAAPRRRVDARPGVLDRRSRPRRPRDAPRDAPPRPSATPACDGVLDQVHEHLPELDRVPLHRRQRVEALDARRSRRPGARTDSRARRPASVERDALARERPVADHVEQVGDDPVGDAELLADAVDVLLGALVARRRGRLRM